MIGKNELDDLDREIAALERQRTSASAEIEALAELVVEARDELDVYKRKVEALEKEVEQKVYKVQGMRQIYDLLKTIEAKLDAAPKSALDLLRGKS